MGTKSSFTVAAATFTLALALALALAAVFDLIAAITTVVVPRLQRACA